MNQNHEAVQHWVDERESSLDLDFFWKVMYSNRWLIFTITALVFAFSTIHSLRLPSVYTGRTTILLEVVDQSAFQNPELLELSSLFKSQFYLATRVEMIRSRPVLEEAARVLNLAERYHLQTDEQGARIIRGKVKASVVKGTQLIEIEATDQNPQMAADIANAVAESFVKESWRERLFVSDQLLQWFPKEAQTLERNSPIQQLKELDNENAIEALPSIIQNSIVQSLKRDRLSLDAEMQELSGRYTAEHPRIKELKAKADYLDAQLKFQIDKIISGLKSGLVGEFGISNVRIIEPADVPSRPSGPARLLIILSGTLIALMGSVAISAALYYFDQTIRTEDDIRNLQMTFLNYIPLISSPTDQTRRFEVGEVLDQIFSDHRFSDEVTNLRASVLFSMPADRSKLLMCTSAIPEDGKTAIVSMLGISLAESGERVLLIDADMRKPHLHEAFKLENKTGLSNCLVGSSQPEDAIQVIERIEGLHIMTAGEKAPNPAILLGSQAMDRFIQKLEKDFDRILFDVPPALHIADSLILSGKVHGIVLIFRNGRVHRDVGRKLKERIVTAGGVIVGCVVNAVDYRKMAYPYYYYYSRYEGYYRSKGKKKADEPAHAGFVSNGLDIGLGTHSQKE